MPSDPPTLLLPRDDQVEKFFDEANSLADTGAPEGLNASLERFLKVLELYIEARSKSKEGTTLRYIGLIYSSLGEKQKALNYLNRTLPILKEVGDRAVDASTLANIRSIHQNTGEKISEIVDFASCLRSKNSLTICSVNSNLSRIAEMLNSYSDNPDFRPRSDKELYSPCN